MKTCPKCRYTRTPSDTAPEYECPKCGVIYAKAFAQPAQPAQPTLAAEPDSKNGRLVVVAAVLLIAGGVGAWLMSSKGGTGGPQVVAAAPVADPAAAKKVEEQAFLKRQAEERERQLLDKATKDLERLHGRWKDASMLASSTSRIALATPVASLQSIRREVVEMVVPECLDGPKAALLQGMEKEIEAYMNFMQDANIGKLLAQNLFTEARDAFEKYAFRMKDACPKG